VSFVGRVIVLEEYPFLNPAYGCLTPSGEGELKGVGFVSLKSYESGFFIGQSKKSRSLFVLPIRRQLWNGELRRD